MAAMSNSIERTEDFADRIIQANARLYQRAFGTQLSIHIEFARHARGLAVLAQEIFYHKTWTVSELEELIAATVNTEKVLFVSSDWRGASIAKMIFIVQNL